LPKTIPIFYSALLLTGVNLLLRLVGTTFQVYISNALGAAGVGLLQLTMSVGSLAMVAGIAGIRTAAMYLTAEELGRKREQNVTWVLSGCFLYSILCSTAIIILLIFNVMLKKHSEDNLNRLDSQIKLQISHYEKLDRHNAEMRRFRHDYRNHLRAILSLISMDETEEAREYISNILNIEEIPELAFDTGNCLADAILTDKSEQFSDGTIDFKGIIPDSLDNADICTVLSNALDNAIEACVACGNKHIDINSNVKQGYFVITIANPTDMENFSGKIPETTKPDPSSHGYGLISIETIARKNNGRIKLNCENGRFTLSVLMKV